MMAMVRPKSQDDDADNGGLRQAYRLDKIAIAIIGVVLTFMFGQMWTLTLKLNDLEIRQAETRGQVQQIVGSMNNLVEKGSQTAQRTEVLVQQLLDRTQRYEEFMAKGRRFTADDGDKLERRIERLEQQKNP